MTAPSEIVHFEIPDLASAVRLSRRLGQRWTVLLQEARDIDVVSVHLRPWPGDIAILLREVETWVAGESIYAIRYQLDGREYVLEAGEADWQSAPAGCL
jgi:hypothetical protein